MAKQNFSSAKEIIPEILDQLKRKSGMRKISLEQRFNIAEKLTWERLMKNELSPTRIKEDIAERLNARSGSKTYSKEAVHLIGYNHSEKLVYFRVESQINKAKLTDDYFRF